MDWSVVVFYLGALGEVKYVIASETPPYVWAALAAALLYVVLGPWLLARFLARRGSSRAREDAASPRLLAAGLCLVALGLAGFSLVPGAEDTNRSFSLSPPVNLLATGIGGPGEEELSAGEPEGPVRSPLENVKLEETPDTTRRNVVIISLESTRAKSVTPYNPDIETTPYLDELAEKSLLVERAYTEIPHTSKALTAVNCGIYPDTDTQITGAKPGGIPARCLPELLEEQGYNTAYLQSATETFEDRPVQVENLGFGYFQALEDMDKEGFQRANYLGYEDDIMLEPSREWLEENAKEAPFMVMYDTITPHHEYLAPDRYGIKDFAEDPQLDGYLNGVRYVDFFVKNIIEQYKDLGLYEDTIFVILGDHGEAFGEHGVRGHDGVIYEEGQKVPLIVHDPKRWQNGERVSGETPVNQLDVAPTILEMLGYEAVDGEYPGRSFLGPLPRYRTLFMSCRPDPTCAASIEGDRKYIYHYGNQPEEFYDLSEDPRERNNIAGQLPPGELERRREELLEWRSRTAALYDDNPPSEPGKVD